MIYKVNTKVYANTVEPGMVVGMPDGIRIPADRVELGYNTVTVTSASGCKATCDYAALVEVLGYFNR